MSSVARTLETNKSGEPILNDNVRDFIRWGWLGPAVGDEADVSSLSWLKMLFADDSLVFPSYINIVRVIHR